MSAFLQIVCCLSPVTLAMAGVAPGTTGREGLKVGAGRAAVAWLEWCQLPNSGFNALQPTMTCPITPLSTVIY